MITARLLVPCVLVPIICSAVNYSHLSTLVIVIITLVIVIIIVITIIIITTNNHEVWWRIPLFSQHYRLPIIRSIVNHSLPNVWGYWTSYQSHFLFWKRVKKITTTKLFCCCFLLHTNTGESDNPFQSIAGIYIATKSRFIFVNIQKHFDCIWAWSRKTGTLGIWRIVKKKSHWSSQ